MTDIVIREISPDKHPILHSQTLNLRNQLLRLPLGLDLFQTDDLEEEAKSHITLCATITTNSSVETGGGALSESSKSVAKSDDNNAINSSRKEDIDSVLNRNEKERVVGCILLAPFKGEESTFKVRQMAVCPDFQGKGLGTLLVTEAEKAAKQRGKTRLYVHGRKHAVGFYLKSGFTKVKDEEFMELGIPHHALEKTLT